MRFSVPFVPEIDDGLGTNPVPGPSIKREDRSAYHGIYGTRKA
jgi:hypothetical protein